DRALAQHTTSGGREQADAGRGRLRRYGERREHSCRLGDRCNRQPQLDAVLERRGQLPATALTLFGAKHLELLRGRSDERILFATHGLGTKTRGRARHRRQIQFRRPLRERRQRAAVYPWSTEVRRTKNA